MFVRQGHLWFHQPKQVWESNFLVTVQGRPTGDITTTLLHDELIIEQDVERKELAERPRGYQRLVGDLQGFPWIPDHNVLIFGDILDDDFKDHVVNDRVAELFFCDLLDSDVNSFLVQFPRHRPTHT